MQSNWKKIVLAAALLCGANVGYAVFNPAEAGVVQAPCGNGCYDSSTCTNNCACFPMIGQPKPGWCTN